MHLCHTSSFSRLHLADRVQQVLLELLQFINHRYFIIQLLFSNAQLIKLSSLNRKQNPASKLLQRTLNILNLGVMQEID